MNFRTLRKTSVKEIVNWVDAEKVVLIQSTTFTGKTSLLDILHDELLAKFKVVVVDLLTYNPVEETVQEYLSRKYSFALQLMEDPKADHYLLFDEVQKLYPCEEDPIRDTYGEILSSDKVMKIKASHESFFELVKKAKGLTHFKGIFFSGYGSHKQPTGGATPVVFNHKTTKYWQFTNEEYDDLLQDFLSRTQIQFIRSQKAVPDSFKSYVKHVTDRHVGYVAAILGICNKHSYCIFDEESLLNFVRSKELYVALLALRPTPRYESMKTIEQNALKTIWQKERDILSNNTENYTILVRHGWIAATELISDQEVFLICPLSKQLIMMRIYSTLKPPEQDTVTSLADLMDKFLSVLNVKKLQETFSVSVSSKNRVITEAFWQVILLSFA
jgi:hypothetical protein